jgi:hypothetical protein
VAHAARRGEARPLAPDAPAYTPRARVWQWLKATVDGATALDTIADVIHRGRQLVWHAQQGWLTATIHGHGADYQSIV